MKITKDMVGLDFTVISLVETGLDEYRLKIKFEELSEEGLSTFNLTHEDKV
jgi:hypothetical protein